MPGNVLDRYHMLPLHPQQDTFQAALSSETRGLFTGFSVSP